MKKPLKVLLYIGAFVVSLILLTSAAIFAMGYFIFGSANPAPEAGKLSISWKSDLPSTATEVREHAWADDFLPDYDYYLRARITKPEFDALVQKLELTPHTSTRTYSETGVLSWSGHLIGENDWWHPTDQLEGTYVRQEGTNWSFAKYENGYLYFRALHH